MFRFDLYSTLITIPGIIIALSFHEFAHAFVSDRLGDPTPRKQGRLTLSPIPHIDPLGFLMLILLNFGWAKPVQVNPRYYKNPRRDEILVSVAGPITNLLLAFALTGLMRLFIDYGGTALSREIYVNVLNLIFYAIRINVILFIFNLLPLPPLDGSHVIANIIPSSLYRGFYTIQQYSNVILILLIVTGVISRIIFGPSMYILRSMLALFGLNNLL